MKSILTGRQLGLVWIAVVGVLVALPWVGADPANIRLITLIAILALSVSALNLTLGYAGELALNQVAIYAAGAYVSAYTAINHSADLLLCLALSVVAALAIGLLTGAPGLRLGGWTLAITSFFVVLLVPSVVNVFGETLGGFAGLNGIPLPSLFGRELSTEEFYVVLIIVAALWFAVFRNIVVSRHGSALLVLKESPVLAAAVGTSVYRTKMVTYALSGIPAGMAGCFAAFLDSFLSPVSLNINLVIVILAASILGGSMSVYGAIVGAAIMEIGPLRTSAFDQYATIAYGVFLVIGGLLLRNGIAGIAHRLWDARFGARRRRPAAEEPPAAEFRFPEVEGRALRISKVGKSFGGNRALDGVGFVAEAGRITALVGPNGSGKTTLMNLVSGYYRADQGTIELGDRPISGLPAYRVARCGVGRTFQTPMVPHGLTVAETITTGRLGSHPVPMIASALRLPAHWRALAEEAESGRRIMGALGLSHLAGVPAADLALGTRRMLELGRAVAGGSALILLDEVASGLDESDIQDLVAVLGKLRDAGVTIVLVEHNFALVRAIADHVVVLAEGRVLAEGDPEEIATHPDVVSTYLGAGGEISGTRLATAESE
ncbi:branched-chain amino acid ABC transporter ATP-binding protein/permease [Actinomadura livida]|uniref:Branched-chain amino acid ABC transporter ATP-binding protein/permease n=1 Tax=Actinomadura livida TaxID=79909 RepID=A0A7W7IF32_9ACTN|nr:MULTISPECIES: branched-chain amino acid ABC transporter ATP-binding protein/permease [Actinomadura]MBB4775944.1 branched-chain amino acid transport system permease protein [Actinomadura catellatispora]GGU16599.1 branched-chain amino acid ABC transporter permease [Actinomadura livida]